MYTHEVAPELPHINDFFGIKGDIAPNNRSMIKVMEERVDEFIRGGGFGFLKRNEATNEIYFHCPVPKDGTGTGCHVRLDIQGAADGCTYARIAFQIGKPVHAQVEVPIKVYITEERLKEALRDSMNDREIKRFGDPPAPVPSVDARYNSAPKGKNKPVRR